MGTIKERTQDQIDEQIKWLMDNKRQIPQTTAFGDDNWAKIDAQIAVLKEVMDEDEVADKLDNGDWTESEAEAAREAVAWRDDGDDSAQPSEAWSSLVGRGAVAPLPPPHTLGITSQPSGRVSVDKPNLASKPKEGGAKLTGKAKSKAKK